MQNGKHDPWKLFNARFKKYDQVVIIDYDDTIYYGTLDFCSGKKAKEKFQLIGCNGGVRIKEFNFVDIRFMSHDGFSIAKLLVPDKYSKELIEKLDIKNPDRLIKETLIKETCVDCGEIKLTGKECSDCSSKKGMTSFGGSIAMQSVYPGSVWSANMGKFIGGPINPPKSKSNVAIKLLNSFFNMKPNKRS